MPPRSSQLIIYFGFAMLFVLIIVVGFVVSMPSEERLWNIFPNVEGTATVRDAFDGGEYRFLAVRYGASDSDENAHIPGINGCNNHPNGSGLSIRRTETLPTQDAVLLEQVRNFARHYNVQLAKLLNEHHAADCQILYTF